MTLNKNKKIFDLLPYVQSLEMLAPTSFVVNKQNTSEDKTLSFI